MGLDARYLEVWTAAPVVPLVHFAAHVESIPATGLDLLEIPDQALDPQLIHRLQHFDQIVSWYGAARPEFRHALTRVNSDVRFLEALPPARGTMHAIDFFLTQAGAPAGAAVKLPFSREEGRFIVIHPFSGSTKKNWPLERFQAVARELECDMPVFWSAGPDEELSLATRYQRLDDLADWIANASVYIGNDSGITHLAAACGVPTLALFGPTDPRVWGPRGERVRILHREELEDIAINDVLDAASALLPDAGEPAVAGRAAG